MRKADLAAIPYLDLEAVEGRVLTSLMFYAQEDWHCWFELGDQSLRKIWARPSESTYFAAAAADPGDLYLHCLDFLAQRAALPSLMRARSGIIDDVLNLATVLAKFEALPAMRPHFPEGLSRVAATEVELVVTICRSLFDLLQEVIVHIWPTIRFHDDTLGRRPPRGSFRKMLQVGDVILEAEEIARHHGLPMPLATCYAEARDIFFALRRYRDNIVHKGSQVQHIFDADGLFLISSELAGFPNLVAWTEDERHVNDLVPLRPAINMLIYRTLMTCEHFTRTLETIIQFPPPLVPGMNQFLRGHSTGTLIAAMHAAEARMLAASSL